ncbi:hypothetical protein C8A01DRAFT_33863 [Parachaetomium inaequale]|uniref:Uncharacterized protein n=1 Tax=Parachaetomium inaequale TaxID=2588326 RepID=A0AAN6PJE7_9PEZI|nr:hypothetical protein C8A01DRAFT_33863 [Parachaetomium inaequale]
MGNLCSSERDPFSQPGRPLGTTPPTPTSASVPAAAKSPRTVGGPPRTLGGSSSPTTAAAASGPDDARQRAAAAAEERDKKAKQGGGKLKAKLAQRRAMTDADALEEASRTEQRQREVDESASALAHS